MKTVKELDALVAERVMGEPMPTEFPFDWETSFQAYLHGEPKTSAEGNWVIIHIYEEGDEQQWQPQPFSTDNEVARQVTKKMSELDEEIAFTRNLWERIKAESVRGLMSAGEAYQILTASPLNICLAALKTVGVKV